MKKTVMLLLSLSFLTGCHCVEWLNDKLGMKDDNVVEESVEGVIEHYTGVDVDLTPRSPEKK